MSIYWFLADDCLRSVAEGVIQRLQKLGRLDCDLPLHQFLIIVFVLFALLVPFVNWLRQIILKLVVPLIPPSLFPVSLIPFLHALAQLSHEFYLFLHPLQLLQKLISGQLRTHTQHLPANREGALHELLVTQRLDVGYHIKDDLVQFCGILNENVMDDPQVELHWLVFDLFFVKGGLTPTYLRYDGHGLIAVLEALQVVFQLPERQHNSN